MQSIIQTKKINTFYLNVGSSVLLGLYPHCNKSELVMHGRAIRFLLNTYSNQLNLNQRACLFRQLNFLGKLYRLP